MEKEEIEKNNLVDSLVDKLMSMAEIREEVVNSKRASGTNKEVLTAVSEKILKEYKNTHSS